MKPSFRIAPLDPALVGYPASVPEALARRAEQPDTDFVVGTDTRLTYGEADRQSLELAARLMAAGVGKGTRVGLMYGNSPEWVIAWLAAARIGALTVPLSTFSPPAELARAVRHGDVHGILIASTFCGEDLATRFEEALPGLHQSTPSLRVESAPFLRWAHVEGGATAWSSPLDDRISTELVLAAQSEVGPSDPLAMISTSGTTSAPKAVVHTHGSLVRHAALLADRRGYSADDRIYSPMPFFWVGGLTMLLLSALTSGAVALVQERFDPEGALDLCEREAATQISCWPNAAQAMAEHPTFPGRDLGKVRGGTLIAALPAAQRPAAADLATNVLGMSETGGPHTGVDEPYLPLPVGIRGTFGRSLPGMEHLIVDPDTGEPAAAGVVGELLLRGEFLMHGLYTSETRDVLTPDGWYPTGDLGWFGDDGLLRFTGRGTSMIKTAGANVSPAEVAETILGLVGVREVHVLGVPAGNRGEDVVAVVVVEPGVTLATDDVLAVARQGLSTFKVPKRCRVIEPMEVPMLPTGKPDLVRMRGWFA